MSVTEGSGSNHSYVVFCGQELFRISVFPRKQPAADFSQDASVCIILHLTKDSCACILFTTTNNHSHDNSRKNNFESQHPTLGSMLRMCSEFSCWLICVSRFQSGPPLSFFMDLHSQYLHLSHNLNSLKGIMYRGALVGLLRATPGV